MDKTELRRLLKEKRKGLSVEQKTAMDKAIVDHIAHSQEFKDASVLLLYAPMEGEINLLPLARLAREAGKPIAFPKCDVETNTMEFYILTPDARLCAGAYGIAEPPSDAPLCVPDEKALCILPALTFDPQGNRLGYGKGYYDRYLATFCGVTVGAAYASFLVRHVPTDSHDVPVQFLATDRGMLFCQRTQITDAPEEETEEAEAELPRSTSKVDSVKGFFKALGNAFSQSDTKPRHLPPILVLCTYLLLLLSRVIDTQLLDRDNEYLGVILLQVLIFIIPAAVYCRIAGGGFSSRIRLRPIRLTHFFFLIFLLIVMVSGSLLTSILTGGISSLSGNFTLYGTFVAHTGTPLDVLYAILAYALLPAFGEELVFRSILCAEYEGRGVAVAVSISALFFAMLHFSIAHFLTYFVLGIFLALSMYVTRSFFAPLLLHLCYNIFCLFGQPYLSAFYVNAGSNEIFLFCLIALFLLFSAFAVGEARKIYHIYANKNADSSYTVPLKLKETPKQILLSLLSPVSGVCVAVWLITVIVTLI